MEAIFDRLAQVLDIISKGGPQAIIAILFLDIVLMTFANYFIVRFIINFIKEQNTNRDKILAEKDQVIKDRIEKMEQMVSQYNKAQMESTDAIRKIESAINETKNLIIFMNTKFPAPNH
jgi:predicted PurR-regulated permease PerM